MPKIKNQLQLDGMEEEEVIKLSPTSLNLYLECPRCFWLHFNKKIRRPSGPFPSLPGGMDQVLKIYFDEYRGTEILPPIVAEKLQGKLMDPLPKSLMLTDKGVRAILTGKLDEALDLGGGKFAVVDHKTRGWAPKEDPLPMYQLQMDAYDLLLRENGYDTNNQAYLVYYYPTPGQLHDNFPFAVSVHELTTNPDRARQVLHDAVNVLRGELPDSVKTCAYCGWARLVENVEDN